MTPREPGGDLPASCMPARRSQLERARRRSPPIASLNADFEELSTETCLGDDVVAIFEGARHRHDELRPVDVAHGVVHDQHAGCTHHDRRLPWIKCSRAERSSDAVVRTRDHLDVAAQAESSATSARMVASTMSDASAPAGGSNRRLPVSMSSSTTSWRRAHGCR